MNESTYHLIDQFLSGELVGVELDKFKAAMKEDDTLKKAVDLQRVIISSIEQVREEELRQYIQEQTMAKTFSMSKKGWTILSSAAVIVLLSVATIVFLNNREIGNPETAQQPTHDTEPTSIFHETDSVSSYDSMSPQDLQPVQDLAVADPAHEPLLNTKEMIQEADMEENISPESAADEMKPTAGLAMADRAVDPDDSYGSGGFSRSDTGTQYKGSRVRSDQLLSKRSVAVNTLNLELNRTNEEGVYDVQEKRARRRDKKEAYAESEVATAERNITIEHWKSVVNYVGYHYDGSTLQLYGIDKSSVQKVQELDNRLYLQLDGKQYFIEVNKTYNRLVEVTNPLLLNVLNE